MKIPINHQLLTDSPYNPEATNVFTFPNTELDELVQDLIHGNRTCYLISGYRGAGKSSYIKKLQNELKTQTVSSEANHLFVELNFAKYEERSIVLRKLIRTFYIELARDEKLFSQLSKSNPKSVKKLIDLYERTFYDVSKNTNSKELERNESEISFESNVLDIISIPFSIIVGLGILAFEELPLWLRLIIALLSATATLFQVRKSRVKSKESSEEITMSELYDDEIAEHYLLQVLDDFKDLVIPVFVLDELDKIKDDVLAENLINELKPIMLSGKASFMVVAGQSMFYRYYESKLEDDGILSSLFSKVHHVSLMSAAELRTLFDRLILTNNSDEGTGKKWTDNERKAIDGYKECLVFHSMRVPRKFMLQIRNEISWDNGNAYVEIDEENADFELYEKVNSRIDKVENDILSQPYDNAIADYIKMKLIIQAHEILGKKNDSFSIHELSQTNSDEEE